MKTGRRKTDFSFDILIDGSVAFEEPHILIVIISIYQIPHCLHFPQHFGVPQYRWSIRPMSVLILLYSFFIIPSLVVIVWRSMYSSLIPFDMASSIVFGSVGNSVYLRVYHIIRLYLYHLGSWNLLDIHSVRIGDRFFRALRYWMFLWRIQFLRRLSYILMTFRAFGLLVIWCV
jgi:hypothetical protein